ncbi:MAG: TlpA family protein disulfide reductase [Candidatus Nitricoxidivorans perseverans]|uniref:TlpA family protein disulfide reductase n=1 Tax=Candidatus Nitricoxidivorans perseverans TaxID=2975601 RepID=A0AA49FNH9_9PROT|nr:MAG: TlpA family protein disulfide reductase [Candidatus Nitricoxidivorans perseverans]
MKHSLFALAALLVEVSSVFAQESMPSTAPLFSARLHDLDDKPIAMSAFQGQPLVVNFWARWCGPCKEEIPELIRARAKYKGKGLEVVGIAIEDNAGAVNGYARAYEIDYPVLLSKDKGIPLMQALGNPKAGLPYTLVLDRNGRVVHKKLGLLRKADMDAAFEAALK